MSTRGEVLQHPINGTSEQTWDGFSWPAFFFGVIWLLIKGLYGHFLISLILLLITAGFAAPIIWIVYGFIGNGAHKNKLLSKGYLTIDQWKRKTELEERPQRSNSAVEVSEKDPVSKLRELVELKEKGFLTEEEFSVQKAKILNT